MFPTAPWRELPFSFVKLTLKVQETWKKSETGSGYLKCHILIIVDAQFDIKNNELESITCKYWHTRTHGSKQQPVQHSLIMDPMNSSKNQFLVNLLCGPFCTWQVWLHHAQLPDWLTIVKTLFEGTNNPLSLTTKSPQRRQRLQEPAGQSQLQSQAQAASVCGCWPSRSPASQSLSRLMWQWLYFSTPGRYY